MKKFRQYLSQKNVSIIVALGVCLLAGAGVFLVNNPFPRIRPQSIHKLSRRARVSEQRAKLAPLVTFKIPPSQNSTTIIDQPITTTGCRAVNLNAGMDTNIEMESNNLSRTYRLYLPLNYSNITPHPLVLNFHGYAANAFDEERISKFDILANTNNFVVVYPNGSFDKYGFRGWNTGLHPSITSPDVLYISNLLNQIQSTLCIDPTKIYATGFSNGGGFVNLLACKLSNRIAAFAPVSGSYVTPFKICTIKRPVPIIEFHGTADQSVPYNGNVFSKELSVLSWINDWIKEDGCLSTPKIFYQTNQVIGYTWPNCKSQASIVHYKIIGEPHTWPLVLFQQTVNNQPQVVNAAAVIWNFFKQHPLTLNTNT